MRERERDYKDMSALQGLFCTYLAHHELESDVVIVTIVVFNTTIVTGVRRRKQGPRQLPQCTNEPPKFS